MANEKMNISLKDDPANVNSFAKSDNDDLQTVNETPVVDKELDQEASNCCDVLSEALDLVRSKKEVEELKKKIKLYTSKQPEELVDLRVIESNKAIRMMPEKDREDARKMISRMRRTKKGRRYSKIRREKQKLGIRWDIKFDVLSEVLIRCEDLYESGNFLKSCDSPLSQQCEEYSKGLLSILQDFGALVIGSNLVQPSFHADSFGTKFEI